MASSKTAVVTAIVSNSIVTVIKFIAASLSGSASMMNEAVHSFMDTLNQAFLLRGLQVAAKPADAQYAFGHMQKKYLWNLWSAIGLFSIGAGLGLAHAWHSYHQMDGTQVPVEEIMLLGVVMHPLTLIIVVLSISLLLEGYSFMVAVKAFWAQMKADGLSNPFRYLLQSDDPTLVAVVLEDSVAILGLVLAAIGIGLSAVTGNPVWDIGFSAVIAVMLGTIAFYLGFVNMQYLSDMRDVEAEAVFRDLVVGHAHVERWHDLRSIILDENHTLLIAEVELREESMVVGLQQNIAHFVSSMPKPTDEYARNCAVVQATLEKTEMIIDELSDALKQRLPRVSHVTIEVEGIAPSITTGDGSV